MKKIIWITIIAILLCDIILIKRFNEFYGKSCEIYAETGIKGTLKNSINICASEYLNDSYVSYSEITEITRENSGQITSIVIDSIKINTIANELSVLMYETITDDTFDFGIPLGNTVGSKFFSGKGPKINVSVVPTGFVNYTINSELKSAGINQALHRIAISFACDIKCLAPFHTTASTIEYEIIIAETLIVGKIPEVMFAPYQ